MTLSPTFGLRLWISFVFFAHTGPTEHTLQDKFSPAPPKMEDSYQKDEICLKLSKYDIQVHYSCAIPVNWSQTRQAESLPVTLSAIYKMTSQTTEG